MVSLAIYKNDGVSSPPTTQPSDCSATGSCSPTQVVNAQVVIDKRAITNSPDLLYEAISTGQVSELNIKISPQQEKSQDVEINYILTSGDHGELKLDLNNHYQAMLFNRLQTAASDKHIQGKMKYSTQQKGQLLKTIWNVATWPIKALWNLTLGPMFNAMGTSFNLDTGRTLNQLAAKAIIALLGIGVLGATAFWGLKKVRSPKFMDNLKNKTENLTGRGKNQVSKFVEAAEGTKTSILSKASNWFKSLFQQNSDHPSVVEVNPIEV